MDSFVKYDSWAPFRCADTFQVQIWTFEVVMGPPILASIIDFDQLSLNCNQQKEAHHGKGIMVER